MKLKGLKGHFSEKLKDQYPPEEIQSFFSILSEKFLGYNRFQVSLNSEEIIKTEIIGYFEAALQRLANNEPVQYITGETEFFGLPFKVNEHTLIPRPETEELVAWILSNTKIKNKEKVTILDIGTGTGCIAISLAKNLPDAHLTAIDFSEKAIEIAKANADLNAVDVEFMVLDILQTKELHQNFDVIVSNPPYVRELEKKQMQENVIAFEPASALFVDEENPLVFYKKITQLAQNHLNTNGLLFFEINEYLGKEMILMMNNEGFTSVEVKKDIFKKDRMIQAKKE